MSDDFKNYIDGKWVVAASGSTFVSINPANKTDVLGAFPKSDYRDVDGAAESARAHAETWRLVSAERRGEILRRAAGLLRDREHEFARLVTRETGKLLPHAAAEVREAAARVERLATEGTRWAGAAAPLDASGRLEVVLPAPVGVVAAIAPWYDPLGWSAEVLAACLVAGNALVLKPAEDAPLVATRLAEVLLEAGLPPGVMNLVHGGGEEAGAPLVRHPEVALVAFGGSAAVGREVAIACAAARKGALLATDGPNALMVLEDGDLEAALEAAVAAAFATAGQGPAALGRIVLQRRIAGEFTERIVRRAEGLRLGDGMAPSTDVGPLVNEARARRAHAFTRLAAKEGARLLCGGEPFREGECRRGFFYLPTVFGEVRPAMRVAREVSPGPAACLLAVDDLEEGIGLANRAGFGPSVAVYTRDVQRASLAVRDLQASRIVVNGPPRGGGFALPRGAGRAAAAFATWKAVALEGIARPPGGG